MQISFTKRAQGHYHSILIYLLDEWGANTANVFEQKVLDFFAVLSEFPEMGSLEEPDKMIRGFQLTKQIRVLYRIKGKRIIVLAFFDVRQNPYKKWK